MPTLRLPKVHKQCYREGLDQIGSNFSSPTNWRSRILQKTQNPKASYTWKTSLRSIHFLRVLSTSNKAICHKQFISINLAIKLKKKKKKRRYPLGTSLGPRDQIPYISTINLYFNVIVACCGSQYLSLRDSGSNVSVYPLDMWIQQGVCTCAKWQNRLGIHLYAPSVFMYVYPSIRELNKSTSLQDLFGEKKNPNPKNQICFLVSQFSIMAQEKLELRVLEEGRSKSSDYSGMNDKDDPFLWNTFFHNRRVV